MSSNLTLTAMYTTISKFFVVVVALCALVGLSGKVFATVGGPKYISGIALSTLRNTIYYTLHDNGGRGCPPIVHAIDLTTLKDTEVKSCTQVEEGTTTEVGQQHYVEFVSDLLYDLPFLGSVSLKRNNIAINVDFLSEHTEEGYTQWSEFRAHIIQDDKEVGQISFRGCSQDQPHIFEGYMVPNSDTMLILISNKGDCFEGGYVYETLRIIKGVTYHDTNIVRSYKDASATEPNSGNLVVYAGSHDVENNDEAIPQKSSMSNVILLSIASILGAVVGYGAALTFHRKRV